jgi:HlyD family secretion protein
MKKHRTRIALSLAVLALVVLLGRLLPIQLVGQVKRETTTRPKTEKVHIALACPGRIEGRSETISVGAATGGVIQSINVREGETVTRGETLALIGCGDLASARGVARAEADSLRQTRIRLMHGSRNEERQAAAQKTIAARAVLAQAKGQMQRMTDLWDAAVTSRASFEEARRDYDVGDAELKQAMRNEDLSNAPPLAEELAKADADIHAAEQRVQLVEDRLDKCVVRAPEDGTILRVYMRPGESFALLLRTPLFSMADVSVKRVRAEVDERDIQSVSLGQKIFISTETDQRYRTEGRVVKIAPMMGHKSVFTGEPTDRSDRDVLEVLADLNARTAESLPVGLRVTVVFLR